MCVWLKWMFVWFLLMEFLCAMGNFYEINPKSKVRLR